MFLKVWLGAVAAIATRGTCGNANPACVTRAPRAELIPIYRNTILPLADIITPNQFELEQLLGCQIETYGCCRLARSRRAREVHAAQRTCSPFSQCGAGVAVHGPTARQGRACCGPDKLAHWCVRRLALGGTTVALHPFTRRSPLSPAPLIPATPCLARACTEEGVINILASNKPASGPHTRVHLAVPKIDFYFTGTGAGGGDGAPGPRTAARVVVPPHDRGPALFHQATCSLPSFWHTRTVVPRTLPLPSSMPCLRFRWGAVLPQGRRRRLFVALA